MVARPRAEEDPANIIMKNHRPGRQTRRGHHHQTLLRLVQPLARGGRSREHHHEKSPPWPSNSPRTSSSDARSGGAAARSWRKVPRTSSSKITALAVKLAADIIIRRSFDWCSRSRVPSRVPSRDHPRHRHAGAAITPPHVSQTRRQRRASVAPTWRKCAYQSNTPHAKIARLNLLAQNLEMLRQRGANVAQICISKPPWRRGTYASVAATWRKCAYQSNTPHAKIARLNLLAQNLQMLCQRGANVAQICTSKPPWRRGTYI
jgi:hypothetical protein